MSVFNKQDTVTTTKVLPYAPSSVLAIIQSPSEHIHLNPYVTSATPSETDPLEWKVVTSTPVFAGLSWNSPTITAKYEVTPDGVIITTDAGHGVTVKSTWTCVAAGASGESSTVSENAELTASILLVGYVAGTLKKSSETVMDELEKKLKEKAA